MIGYARNPEPNDPVEHPLNEVDWDLPPVDLSDPKVWAEYYTEQFRYNPIRYFENVSDRFYILPHAPSIVRHRIRWIDNVNLEDYEDVKWEDIVKDIKEQAWKNFEDEQEAMRETHGGRYEL